MQGNLLNVTKRMSTFITLRSLPPEISSIVILVLADAARPKECGQLGHAGGILAGELQHDSTLLTSTWNVHRSQRPVISFASAEVLPAGDAIDEDKLPCGQLIKMLNMESHLYIAVGSKDLLQSQSTCRSPEDNVTLADVLLLPSNFEAHHCNQSVWVPGSVNPAELSRSLGLYFRRQSSTCCWTIHSLLTRATAWLDLYLLHLGSDGLFFGREGV